MASSASYSKESKESTESEEQEQSLFQEKYIEFIEDVWGALPEYHVPLASAKALECSVRLQRFQEEVHVALSGLSETSDISNTSTVSENSVNPGTILPGVILTDEVWASLSETSRSAIWEHLRILSMCCFMESSGTAKPAWLEGMMKEMKEKLESVDMEALLKRFSTFFASEPMGASDSKDTSDSSDPSSKQTGSPPDMPSFPKLPERFLKGQLARLAQEIVKDITPEDLGITPEQVAECEKNPSRAFHILFSSFTQNPAILQRTIGKIGKRLQQKMASGAIRPQEIAKEAEELMKEFSGNASFVEMMEGLKGAFGMEDMDMARQAGKESSARLSMVRERLRRKLEKKKQAQQGSSTVPIAPTAPVAPTASTAPTASVPSVSKKKK